MLLRFSHLFHFLDDDLVFCFFFVFKLPAFFEGTKDAPLTSVVAIDISCFVAENEMGFAFMHSKRCQKMIKISSFFLRQTAGVDLDMCVYDSAAP